MCTPCMAEHGELVPTWPVVSGGVAGIGGDTGTRELHSGPYQSLSQLQVPPWHVPCPEHTVMLPCPQLCTPQFGAPGMYTGGTIPPWMSPPCETPPCETMPPWVYVMPPACITNPGTGGYAMPPWTPPCTGTGTGMYTGYAPCCGCPPWW